MPKHIFEVVSLLLLLLLLFPSTVGFSQQAQQNSEGRLKATSITLTYTPNFPPKARIAVEYAKGIWETILQSPIPIRVKARWVSYSEGFLASAGSDKLKNFPGAPFVQTLYPIALAEKIAGVPFYDDEDGPHIVISFNKNEKWYYGIDGNTPYNKMDMVSVTLHELAHGFGFESSFSIDPETGMGRLVRGGLPSAYDLGLVNSLNESLYVKYSEDLSELARRLVGHDVFYASPSVLANNNNQPVRIFAPDPFETGSSISHFDLMYKNTPNRLMKPDRLYGESYHDPGILAKSILSDIGWDNTRINHKLLKSTGDVNGPYIVNATFTSDHPPIHDAELHYRVGKDGEDKIIPMALVAGQYQAAIPGNGVHSSYFYYISVKDVRDFVYTCPSKVTKVVTGPDQLYSQFDTGPSAPLIRHTPVEFVAGTDEGLAINAVVTDDIAVEDVSLEYRIGNGPPEVVTLTHEEGSSFYTTTIELDGIIAAGDVIRYRITAKDGNIPVLFAYSPSATDYHQVNVIDIDAAHDSYENDFHTELRDVSFQSPDFAGQHFNLIMPEGFSSGAIHTQHPYPSGEGFPNDELDLIYELLTPIRVKDENATIKFNEIVLVDPSDYVVVEGSKDGGDTWIAFEKDYNCKDNDDWQDRYYDLMDGENSITTGDESLYRTRTIDMLTAFDQGDQVLIRFRLHSDVSGTGWGWAIDNLKIQVDDKGPRLSHDPIDYIRATIAMLPIELRALDPSGVESVSVEYFVDTDEPQIFTFPAFYPDDMHTLNLELERLQPGEVIHYRIRGEDNAGNVSTLPASGYFNVPVINFGISISSYSNDFNSSTNDFAGNSFSITQPEDFEDGAIHSEHFYANGFGLNNTSDYTYTLLKPICVSATNPYIKFDEIAIVETQDGNIPFGSEAFNDYVIVEGSSDRGETWLPLTDGYDALSNSEWSLAFNKKEDGYPWYFQPHVISLTERGDFHAGDIILLRFRLHANATVNAWGWAIDNLNIQNAAALQAEELMEQTENQTEAMTVQVYPNPAMETITVSWKDAFGEEAEIILMSASGQVMYRAPLQQQDNDRSHAIDVRAMNNGFYLVKVGLNGKNITRKVIKVNR